MFCSLFGSILFGGMIDDIGTVVEGDVKHWFKVGKAAELVAEIGRAVLIEIDGFHSHKKLIP